MLAKLSRIAWEVLSLYYKIEVGKDNTMLAATASIQTFGNFLGFNPHLHILASDGCFGESGMFYASPAHISAEDLEPLFRYKVLSMLKKKGLITDRTIEPILSWRHSGFNVYCGDRIYPGSSWSMENLLKIYNKGILFLRRG